MIVVVFNLLACGNGLRLTEIYLQPFLKNPICISIISSRNFKKVLRTKSNYIFVIKFKLWLWCWEINDLVFSHLFPIMRKILPQCYHVNMYSINFYIWTHSQPLVFDTQGTNFCYASVLEQTMSELCHMMPILQTWLDYNQTSYKPL